MEPHGVKSMVPKKTSFIFTCPSLKAERVSQHKLHTASMVEGGLAVIL